MALDGYVLEVLDALAAPAEFVTHWTVAIVGSWSHSPVSDLIGIGVAAPSIWLAYRRGLRAGIVAGLIIGPGLWLLLSIAVYIWAVVTTRPGHPASVELIPMLAMWIAGFVGPSLLVGIPLADWLRRRPSKPRPSG